MSEGARQFPQAASAALKDNALQSALSNFRSGFRIKRAEAIAAIDHFEAMRTDGAKVCDHALAHMAALLEKFEAKVIAEGGHVHWANNAAEASTTIVRILRQAGARTVTKGKSMASEEANLNAHIEAAGITPIETDLGEYIIQLRGETPSHIIAPAFHVTRDRVEENFRAAHSQLDPARDLSERAALVAEARAVLREKFLAADAGITGANMLVAETGSVIIVTNEGNGDLTRLLPKTHIVLATIDKVVATMDGASLLLRLLTRSATGQAISAYASIVSGPKHETDADGPEAFHVVLMDNGRSRLLNTPAHEVLKCIRCGACMNHCPVYGAVGGHAYGTVFPGPIGAALNPGLYGIRAARHQALASSFCGRCDEVCPVKIPLTRIMRFWRGESFAKGLDPFSFRAALKLWAILARFPAAYAFVRRVAAFLLRARSSHGRLSSFPLLHGWFETRDMASPARKSFQDAWREIL